VSRECDLVVGHHLLQGPEVHSISLGTGCVGVLFRRGLLPDSADVDVSALDCHDLISLTPSVAIANLLEGALDMRRREGRRTIAVNSVFVGAALARQGVGIAVVDEFTARGIMDPNLCFRPLRPGVSFDLKALHLAEQPLSRLTRSFLDVMRRIIAQPFVGQADLGQDDFRQGEPHPQAMGAANH